MAFMQGSGVMMGDDPQHLGSLTGSPMAGLPDVTMTPPNGTTGMRGILTVPTSGSGGGRTEEERQLSQWGYHETKEFIGIRAQVEKEFVETRGNYRHMWEEISSQMKERGYRRTPAQCKCKWKVLVNRYKSKEVGEDDGKAMPPFYEELDAIFKERARSMDRLLLESETGAVAIAGGAATFFGELPVPVGAAQQAKTKPSRAHKGKSDEENSEEEEEQAAEAEEGEGTQEKKKRKYTRRDTRAAKSMQQVLEQFFLQQLKLEQEWREAVERREAERRQREKEWRDRMEALEKERFEREVFWQVKEQERRAREDARAERRDQLIATLLAKLS